MSNSLTTYQKTQSIIGIAALVQTQRINNSLKKLQESQVETNRLQKETNRNTEAIAILQNKANNLQSQANRTAEAGIELQKIDITLQEEERKRIRLKEEQEELFRSELNDKKDAIYHARGDSKEIVESEVDAVEKFFKLNSIIVSLMDAKIESKDFESYEDKGYADDTNKIIYSRLDEIAQSLTDEQREDITTITDILSVDEEEEIKTLSSQLQAAKKNVKSLEKRIETVNQAKDSKAVAGVKTE